jgi:hypothetical protein
MRPRRSQLFTHGLDCNAINEPDDRPPGLLFYLVKRRLRAIADHPEDAELFPLIDPGAMSRKLRGQLRLAFSAV